MWKYPVAEGSSPPQCFLQAIFSRGMLGAGGGGGGGRGVALLEPVDSVVGGCPAQCSTEFLFCRK